MLEPRDALEDDPVVELRRYRDELSKRFKTSQELSAYYETVPTADEFLAELDKEKKKPRRKKKALVSHETT